MTMSMTAGVDKLMKVVCRCCHVDDNWVKLVEIVLRRPTKVLTNNVDCDVVQYMMMMSKLVDDNDLFRVDQAMNVLGDECLG